MKVQVCTDFDQALEACSSPLVWVDAAEVSQAGEVPWLDVPGALLIASAIGALWASAWVIKALARVLVNNMR